MRNTLILIHCFLIAGCATRQQDCLRSASQNLLVIQSLIAEVEANLKQGYAVEKVEHLTIIYQPCLDHDQTSRWCEQPTPSQDTNAAAIDPALEIRKLNALKQTEKHLRTRSEIKIEDCKSKINE